MSVSRPDPALRIRQIDFGDQARTDLTGSARLVRFGYPVMAAIEVSGFIEDGAKLEIEATAVVPEDE